MKINATIEHMLDCSDMLKGSFGTTFRRCGKKTCWCYDKKKKGHASTRISWKDGEVSKTRSVPESDHQWIKDAIEEHRNFREHWRLLRSQIMNLENLLGLLEKESILSTRSKRPYLQG